MTFLPANAKLIGISLPSEMVTASLPTLPEVTVLQMRCEGFSRNLANVPRSPRGYWYV